MNKQIKEALKLLQQTGKKTPKVKGYKIIEAFNIDECEGFIASKDDWFYVVLHHTDSFKDAITDIKAAKNRFYGARVHRGFLSYYKKIKKLIITSYSDMAHVTKNILICGHSMGSAIATLCAYDLSKYLHLENVYCVTTGSPRVGNIRFSMMYNKLLGNRSIRLVNGNDIVTQVPPWFLLYRHVSKRFRIGDWKFWKFWGSTKDHRFEEYVKNYKE